MTPEGKSVSVCSRLHRKEDESGGVPGALARKKQKEAAEFPFTICSVIWKRQPGLAWDAVRRKRRKECWHGSPGHYLYDRNHTVV